MGMYRDRQDYHTDWTLHKIGNVQGTDRNITLTEHYTRLRMYRNWQECHTDGTSQKMGDRWQIFEWWKVNFNLGEDTNIHTTHCNFLSCSFRSLKMAMSWNTLHSFFLNASLSFQSLRTFFRTWILFKEWEWITERVVSIYTWIQVFVEPSPSPMNVMIPTAVCQLRPKFSPNQDIIALGVPKKSNDGGDIAVGGSNLSIFGPNTWPTALSDISALFSLWFSALAIRLSFWS